jgi:hypothetical protein
VTANVQQKRCRGSSLSCGRRWILDITVFQLVWHNEKTRGGKNAVPTKMEQRCYNNKTWLAVAAGAADFPSVGNVVAFAREHHDFNTSNKTLPGLQYKVFSFMYFRRCRLFVVCFY